MEITLHRKEWVNFKKFHPNLKWSNGHLISKLNLAADEFDYMVVDIINGKLSILGYFHSPESANNVYPESSKFADLTHHELLKYLCTEPVEQ